MTAFGQDEDYGTNGSQTVECTKYGLLSSITSYFCALEKAKNKCHFGILNLDILDSNTFFIQSNDPNGFEISKFKTEITFICE